MNSDYTTRCTLLDQAKQKQNSPAWDELLNIYKRYIYVIIRSMGVYESDADDVLQKVFLEIWKSLPTYKYNPEKAKFRSWVASVTKNQTISFLRQQTAYNKKLNSVKNEQHSRLDHLSRPVIDKIVQEQWELFLSMTAMDNISKKFSARALEAFDAYSKGSSVKQISEQLSVPADSIYKYISRIKLKLIEEVKALELELDK